MKTIIERVNKENLTGAFNLVNSFIREMHESDWYRDSWFDYESYYKIYFNPVFYDSFIARPDNKKQARGMIIGKQENKNTYGIMNLYVHPRFRKYGIGGQLKDYIEEYAISNNYNKLETITHMSNTATLHMNAVRGYMMDKNKSDENWISFYKILGVEKDGTER